ncbi:hypothetical protein [Pseudomonas sp. BC42]|uniref:hypothetical protein n=1 Tax=Pseudomonas sp. BC42 TaxID=2933816 RepID=UPI001F2416D5|nr:hypothetical protein [Pseudomonas sp. BC42]ULT73020.1 hypothetical protein L1O02_11840 [Pseudomonas sp. BC42]
MSKPTWKERFLPKSETVIVAIVSSAAALMGAFGSSALSLFANKESLNQIRVQNCVQRMDKLEETLRSKGDAFLLNLASITSYSVSPLRNDAGWSERAEKLMENAFMIAVYAPEISVETLKVSNLMRETFNAPEQDKMRVYKELNAAAKKWPTFYFQIMNDVESKRAKCTEL